MRKGEEPCQHEAFLDSAVSVPDPVDTSYTERAGKYCPVTIHATHCYSSAPPFEPGIVPYGSLRFCICGARLRHPFAVGTPKTALSTSIPSRIRDKHTHPVGRDTARFCVLFFPFRCWRGRWCGCGWTTVPSLAFLVALT